MKILLISTELPQPGKPHGGLANSVTRLAQALALRGHQVRLLCYGDSRLSTRNGRVSIEWIPVPCPHWMLALNYSLFLRFATIHTALIRARAVASRVSELLEEGEVDLVHYPNLEGIGSCLPSHVPSICRISCDSRLWKAKGGSDDISHWRVWQRDYLEYKSLKRATRVYAPSLRLASVVSRRSGGAVRVIPTPVFAEIVEDTTATPYSGVESAPYLLFAGSLNRLKGIVEIGAILPQLLQSRSDLRIVFAGPEGPGSPGKSWSSWLRKRAGEHADRVLFPGAVAHEQLYSWYRKSEAVILASRVDNLPNTMLEAMFHQGLVIGTRGASYDEVITDGINGFLCEAENSASLLDAIERVLKLDTAARSEVRTRAAEKMKEFSPEIILPRLEELFLETMTTHNMQAGTR